MDAKIPTISVITATYNAAEHLPKLIESLRAQSDTNFQWVVADGASTDDTLTLLNQAEPLDVVVISEPDFGIYDGLNRAIKNTTSDYYVVIGADDYFYEHAIADFRKAIMSDPKADVVVANSQIGGQLIKPRLIKPWLYGMKTYIAAHSVGTLFRKTLHETLGDYSRQFPIAADELFVLSAAKQQARFSYIDTVAGYHSDIGVSSVDVLGSLLETFRVKIKTGENKYTQLFLLLLKLIKNIKRF